VQQDLELFGQNAFLDGQPHLVELHQLVVELFHRHPEEGCFGKNKKMLSFKKRRSFRLKVGEQIFDDIYLHIT
jgi:hypothetical protein